MNSVGERLAALRRHMAAEGYAALVVPRADEYLGEYLPPWNERLRWLSCFTGSAGVAVVLAQGAALFVDGRYTVQVRREVPGDLFEFHHLLHEPHIEWLARQLPRGARVACDPRLHSLAWLRQAREELGRAGVEIHCDVDHQVDRGRAGVEIHCDVDNLVDRCWDDRPRETPSPALLLAQAFSGQSSLEKRRRLGAALPGRGCDAALVFAPDSVSWLLNLRGTDMPQLPVLLSFALLEASGDLTVFVDPARLPPNFDEHVGAGVTALAPQRAEASLQAYRGRRVLADPETANAWTQLLLEKCGAELVAGDDPVLLPKACKNAVEVEGSRRAHLRDAVAEVRFLCWLDDEVAAGRLHDEAVLSETLLSLRAEGEHFHACSFDTISAAGDNAALCHYNHVTAGAAPVPMDSVYLVDSGGQYTDGTTDITRSVAIGDPGAEVRRLFTLVLKGHIALARARFPAGTTGTHLDALARQFLWREGYDYEHGTGHGVGVFLSVHEGPQRISRALNSVALRPGMIVSNEPGYYRDGAFGMRCENLQVVREAQGIPGETSMLEFESLTLVPFDLRLVQPDLLDSGETAWLDDYHRRVLDSVGPLLAERELSWLEHATRALGD